MHLRCETCGGPEWWCLDRAGEVWILCQDEQCLSRTQTEMFPEEPIWDSRVRESARGDDSDESQVTPPLDPEGGLPF